MAFTIGVARREQQRSLVRTFQSLSVALARSPAARILARARFTAFCRRDSLCRYRWRGSGEPVTASGNNFVAAVADPIRDGAAGFIATTLAWLWDSVVTTDDRV